MLAAPFKVVLDANVLYPFTLRDTLLRAADAGLFQLYWSDEILDEALRNLVGDGIVTVQQSDRLRKAMTSAFPESLVTDYESLVAGMKNDEKDRHVAAAAVKAGAQVVVTINTADFQDLPAGIEAQHPDEFLCNLFDLDPDLLTAIVQKQAGDLKRPPRTFEDIVRALAKMVPDFAECVRMRSADL